MLDDVDFFFYWFETTNRFFFDGVRVLLCRTYPFHIILSMYIYIYIWNNSRHMFLFHHSSIKTKHVGVVASHDAVSVQEKCIFALNAGPFYRSFIYVRLRYQPSGVQPSTAGSTGMHSYSQKTPTGFYLPIVRCCLL